MGKYDVVVFGATGFTGKRITRYLCAKQRLGVELTVAIAGRNPVALAGIAEELGGGLEVIVADVGDTDSLRRMAQQARVLVSAVGPYSTHGHSVVDACVDAGCDYLDVSGEPLFIETVERRLHETARRKGSLVVSAAGFDSVPADMGAQLLADAFVASGWALGSIESFLSVQGPVHGHFATYASAVQGVGAAGDLRRLRRQVARPRLPLLGAPPPRLQRPSWDPSLGAYVASFPGSDASVVKRTLAFNAAHGRPVFHFAANFLMHRALTAWKYTLLGTLAFSLASTALGRSLLLAAPAVFSAGHFTRAGPSEAEMERTRFRMRLVARGWSSADAAASGAAADRVMEARLEGPEPGYVATPVMVAEAALTLLTERGLVVESVGPGGVFTTAACFRGTGYVDRLRRNGVAFDVERNGGPDARG